MTEVEAGTVDVNVSPQLAASLAADLARARELAASPSFSSVKRPLQLATLCCGCAGTSS